MHHKLKKVVCKYESVVSSYVNQPLMDLNYSKETFQRALVVCLASEQ